MPTGARRFSLFQNVQTGSGAHPASDSNCPDYPGVRITGVRITEGLLFHLRSIIVAMKSKAFTVFHRLSTEFACSNSVRALVTSAFHCVDLSLADPNTNCRKHIEWLVVLGLIWSGKGLKPMKFE
jgi:hypothetical protein